MGIVRMGMPTELVSKLQKAYNVQLFVETGTYQGNTALWAAEHFQTVITIEASPEIYAQVVATHSQVKNVKFLYGHSKEQLATLVPSMNEPCIFWLDGHWCGGVSYGEEDECPLLEELLIINRSAQDHFILIDDARLFLNPPPPPHRTEQWPNINAVLDLLAANRSRYTSVFEDVIVSVPESAKSVVAEYLLSPN